jgi:hypothetical protein
MSRLPVVPGDDHVMLMFLLGLTRLRCGGVSLITLHLSLWLHCRMIAISIYTAAY